MRVKLSSSHSFLRKFYPHSENCKSRIILTLEDKFAKKISNGLDNIYVSDKDEILVNNK